MSGVTKHIYDREIFDICQMWKKQLQEIEVCLPVNYSDKDVISLLKNFYPYEWEYVENLYNYYLIKDKHIKTHFGKTRYNMPKPEKILYKIPKYRKLTSPDTIEKYNENFNPVKCNLEYQNLKYKRDPKILRIKTKIQEAKSKTQQVIPEYLDKLIGLYERKNTSQKDKMYIIIELKKYYNKKVIGFFYKLNDTELNKQLREIAFKHLQSFNYRPRCRRQKFMQVHTKNKKRKNYLKKIYPYEKYDLSHHPEELEYRINNGREQSFQSYDYFISHSSKDSNEVQKLIEYQNKIGNTIFCDWINDSDYLKRNLVCKATLKVIEYRLEKSDKIIFVVSNESLKSKWCKYELNYFNELKRPIYFISKEDIINQKFELKKYDEKNFFNPNYKEIVLV